MEIKTLLVSFYIVQLTTEHVYLISTSVPTKYSYLSLVKQKCPCKFKYLCPFHIKPT